MAEAQNQTDNIISMNTDQTWSRMRVEAATAAAQEPILASLLHATILNHESYQAALSYHLAQKLADNQMNAISWRDVFDKAYTDDNNIIQYGLRDLQAAHNRDPACHEYIQPFLYFKGYLSLQSQRVANWLWRHDRRALALFLQSRVSELFAVDIHPAVKIGQGVFIDHATGIVIGETAMIEDDVSILQNVTLGGTGKEKGDRHPKIRRGALISVGAKVLGNIEVGENAKVAAGSVVLQNVKENCTVAGVPAKAVGKCADQSPAKSMDQGFYYDTYSI